MTAPHYLHAVQPAWSADYAIFLIEFWATAVLRAVLILLLIFFIAIVAGYVKRRRQRRSSQGDRTAGTAGAEPAPLDAARSGSPSGQAGLSANPGPAGGDSS